MFLRLAEFLRRNPPKSNRDSRTVRRLLRLTFGQLRHETFVAFHAINSAGREQVLLLHEWSILW